MSSDELKQLCLGEIDKILLKNGKSLQDFECMPQINSPDVQPFDNILLANELSNDTAEMIAKHDELFHTLNEEQIFAYKQILDSVYADKGQMFFVDGFGGSGKTYLWSAVSFRLRSEDKIVLNVASSGIASLLLPGGRTAHSQFMIPLVLVEETSCKIDKDSKKAELLQMASLIIWDEALMINRLAFEAFDRTLRDIMNKVVDGVLMFLLVEKLLFLGVIFDKYCLLFPKVVMLILFMLLSIHRHCGVGLRF